MTTGKSFLAVMILSAAVAGNARADIQCPAGSSRKSQNEPGAQQEWCEQIGSDNKAFYEGPYSYMGKDLKISGTFRNGLRDGTWRIYNGAGKLLIETDWTAGRQDGELRAFVDDGEATQPLEKGQFTLAVRDGDWESRYPNGNIRSKVRYKAGQKDGLEQDYASDGKLTRSAEYKAGRLMELSTYYPGGQKRTEERYGDAPSDYEWSVWSERGQQLLHGCYQRNHPVGDWVRTDPEGKVLRQTRFANGKIVSDSGTKVALDDPALMLDPTPSQLFEQNSERRAINPMGVYEMIVGSATLTSGIYSLKNITPIDPQTGQSYLDIFGYISALEGGLGIGLGIYTTFWVDDFHATAEKLKNVPQSTATHVDRLDRERYMELYLKQENDRLRFMATTDTIIFALLNGATFWHSHNVRCHSCEVAAAVATGASFLPLLTYWMRERTVYRQLEDERSAVFSPSLSVSLVPDPEGHEQYAMGLRWNW